MDAGVILFIVHFSKKGEYQTSCDREKKIKGGVMRGVTILTITQSNLIAEISYRDITAQHETYTSGNHIGRVAVCLKIIRHAACSEE